MNGEMVKGEAGYWDIRETASGGTAAGGDKGGTAGGARSKGDGQQ